MILHLGKNSNYVLYVSDSVLFMYFNHKILLKYNWLGISLRRMLRTLNDC